MRQSNTTLEVSTSGRSLIEITREVVRWAADQQIDTGMLTVFCRHTSASLLITENAAGAVKRDLAPEAQQPAAARGYGY